MIILGIESSCDETAIAIIDNDIILYHSLHSQIDIHKKFGGVIPEIAARSHLEAIDIILNDVLQKSGVKLTDIDGFAATCGPGLAGGLIMGSLAAKLLAMIYKKPFIAVNHLQAHALLPLMFENIAYPFLLLLASGGHTQFVATLGVDRYEILGSTLDDAIGESFDKTARLMGLEYPGGSKIQELAMQGDENKYLFPMPLVRQKNCNFSFSGLKTAVRDTLLNTQLTDQVKKDISASLQKTIVDVVIDRTKNAINIFESRYERLEYLVISGGVAANLSLRGKMKDFLARQNIRLICPASELCTDNGVMVAWAGLKKLEFGLKNELSFPIQVRWSLDNL